MTQWVFGSGTLIMKRTDVANTQPALIGTLQDISVDFDGKIESLLGQFNVAVALGGAELKISGKAKFARFMATTFNNLFLGQTLTTPAMLEMAASESATVSGTAFTVANGATFVEDLVVQNAATGVVLTPVPSAPVLNVSYIPGAAGVGTYTFATGSDGFVYNVFYTYTVTTAGTNKIVMSNQLMGAMPTFALYMKQSFPVNGVTKDLVLKLNACASSKIALAFNNQKFAIPEFDFQAQADASNNWGTLSLSE